ncbi:hypothetical protein DSUL_50269 [Desulfovibrionales bacterium]
MRKFFHIISVAECIAHLEIFSPLPIIEIALTEADNRILAADLPARENLPLANRSCMDGYAISAADLFSASENHPSLPAMHRHDRG